jgi:CRISPR-associated protein Cas5 subtype I-A
MTWLKAEYELGSLFSYRIPDFSSQYALSSLLPGPSTIKLAIVATAIETNGNKSYGEKIFEIVKNIKIKIQMPKSVALSNVLIKRLKKKKDEMKLERTFGIRGYVHYPEPFRIYIKIEENEEDEVKNLLRRIRSFGTSDSVVYCKSVKAEEPSKGCIEPVESLGRSERNVLIVPVKDLNPDSEIKFEHVNPYDKSKPTKNKDIFIKKFYPIPISEHKQGKNWIVYEIR